MARRKKNRAGKKCKKFAPKYLRYQNMGLAVRGILACHLAGGVLTGSGKSRGMHLNSRSR